VSDAPFPPGDVVEVELQNGNWAYIQLVGLTYITSGIPKASLVRVLSGIYESSVPDEKIQHLVELDAAFFSQVALGGMLDYGRMGGQWPLPDKESAVPDLRMWTAPSQENPHGWLLVTSDHELLTEREYSEIHPEVDQAMLPLDEIPVPARLRWLIEVGWTPREARSRRENWWSDQDHPSLPPSEI